MEVTGIGTQGARDLGGHPVWQTTRSGFRIDVRT